VSKRKTAEAIEGLKVGHVFYLGDKYSKSLKAQFLDVKVAKPAIVKWVVMELEFAHSASGH